jgi:hypothetical protein
VYQLSNSTSAGALGVNFCRQLMSSALRGFPRPLSAKLSCVPVVALRDASTPSCQARGMMNQLSNSTLTRTRGQIFGSALRHTARRTSTSVTNQYLLCEMLHQSAAETVSALKLHNHDSSRQKLYIRNYPRETRTFSRDTQSLFSQHWDNLKGYTNPFLSQPGHSQGVHNPFSLTTGTFSRGTQSLFSHNWDNLKG